MEQYLLNRAICIATTNKCKGFRLEDIVCNHLLLDMNGCNTAQRRILR